VDIRQLSTDEPLSPELVLVLSPELRAQALVRLGAPVWPTPRPRAVKAPALAVAAPLAPSVGAPLAPSVGAPLAPSVGAPLAPSVGAMLVARIGQLALIFVVVTILILAMSLVANAMR
jgi:hypothetical protein